MRRKKHKSHIIYKNQAGIPIAGTTTVNGKAFGGYAMGPMIGAAVKLTKQGQEYAKVWKDKADIGTLTHILAAGHIMNKEVDKTVYTEDIIKPAEIAFAQFLDWEQKYQPSYIKTECVVVNEEFQYGGTYDIACEINGESYLIDIKTGRLYPTHKIQLAAYARAEGRDYDHYGLLKLPIEEGKIYDFREVSKRDILLGWELFVHGKWIYDNFSKLEE